MNTINELKGRPIAHNPILDRPDAREFSRSTISSLAIDDAHCDEEELIDVSKSGLLERDYYFHAAHSRFADNPDKLIMMERITTEHVLLREGIVNSLVKVDEFLAKFDLRLFLLSGFRSLELQRTIRALSKTEQGEERTEQMLADPDFYAPHATGAAFDVELFCTKSKRILDTKVPGHPEHFLTDFLEINAPRTQEELDVRDNRRLLHHVLTSNAILGDFERFVANPKEYWHFSRGDKLGAMFAHCIGRSMPVKYSEIGRD